MLILIGLALMNTASENVIPALPLDQGSKATEVMLSEGFSDDKSSAETGSTLRSDGDNQPTREPVWAVFDVEVPEQAVAVRTNIYFTEPKSAEGFLVLYWDDYVLATIDQRLANSVENLIMDIPPELGRAGTHSFSMRLDGYGDRKAGVSLKETEVLLLDGTLEIDFEE